MSVDPEHVPGLDEFAERLSGAFRAPAGGPLMTGVVPRLLTLLAEGRPVSVGRLAADLDRAEDEIAEAVAQLPNVEIDGRGEIAGYGLTLHETRHRVEVGGHRLFTWCALDTLTFPILLNETFAVESPCFSTGEPVRVRVGFDRVESLDPPGAVVSLVTPTQLFDVRGSFCDHVHFFASREAASQWLGEHLGAAVVSVGSAFELGRLLTRSILGPDGSATAEATGELIEADRTVRRFAFREILATGRPWDPAMAAVSVLDAAAVRAAVGHLVEAGRVRTDERGRVPAACGLSTDPTPHRIETGLGSWWTNCAYNALGILGALGADGRIETRSPATGAPIHVPFEQGRPVDSHAVLFLADQSCCSRPNED